MTKKSKPNYLAIPVPALTNIAEVLEWSASLPGREHFDWREGRKGYHDGLKSIMRHLNSSIDGEELDRESGYSHLSHAAAHLCILLDMLHQCDREGVAFCPLPPDEYLDGADDTPDTDRGSNVVVPPVRVTLKCRKPIRQGQSVTLVGDDSVMLTPQGSNTGDGYAVADSVHSSLNPERGECVVGLGRHVILLDETPNEAPGAPRVYDFPLEGVAYVSVPLPEGDPKTFTSGMRVYLSPRTPFLHATAPRLDSEYTIIQEVRDGRAYLEVPDWYRFYSTPTDINDGY